MANTIRGTSFGFHLHGLHFREQLPSFANTRAVFKASTVLILCPCIAAVAILSTCDHVLHSLEIQLKQLNDLSAVKSDQCCKYYMQYFNV